MAIIYPIFPPIVSGFIYNLSAQTVPIETDVIFDTNGILSPGITHVPGNAQITVTTPGKYEITFSVTTVESSQFGLFLNATLVTGSVYGSGAGTQQNNGEAIVALAPGINVLTLRNHSSAAAVTLQTLAGGTQTNVNASVVIKKLG